MVEQYQQQEYTEEQYAQMQYNAEQHAAYQAMEQSQAPQAGNTKALNLEWVVGFNKDIDMGVHYLADEERTEIFYTAAHTGVIYDYETKTQKLLQGHCNRITAVAVSNNKRWVVTADAGEDSLLIVWDSRTGTPVRTYPDPHPGGVAYMDLSRDNQFIVTLGADLDQSMHLWDWTNEKEEGPICSGQFLRTDTMKHQYWIKFNPDRNDEMVTNGKDRVYFHSWSPGKRSFDTYAPAIDAQAFKTTNQYKNAFTKSVYIPNGTEQAVTGTEAGDIIVWDQSVMVSGIGDNKQKRLIKIVELAKEQSLNVLMTVADTYLVCGTQEGKIKFYDFKYWLVSWFEDLNLNKIKSISFSNKAAINASSKSGQTTGQGGDNNLQTDFSCSEFIVSDSSATVIVLRPTYFEAINEMEKKKDMEVLMNGIRSHVSAVACHPTKPLVAFAIGEGYLQIWDYNKKEDYFNDFTQADISTRIKEAGGEEKKAGKNEKKKYQFYSCITFTKDGSELLIGRSDGVIKVFDPIGNEMKNLSGELKASESENAKRNDAIKHIVVSDCGKYFATSDTHNCVCLFKKEHYMGVEDNPIEWGFAGKIRSHTDAITGLAFGEEEDENDKLQTRLFSVGLDRRCFEYNVQEAKRSDSLPVKHWFSIENESTPTACIWYPKGSSITTRSGAKGKQDPQEDLLLTVNEDYKMKLWNPKTSNSRRTCLGPTYGGEIVALKLLKIPTQSGMSELDAYENYMIYSTGKKVVGLIKLPLDGNPHKTMGLVAHPNEVTDICASADGRFIFTVGGDDLALNMWSVDVQPIKEEIELCGGEDSIEPFLNLIEGGEHGQTYRDMKDFFTYAMIKSMKEDTTKTRRLEGTVPVDQLPSLMRAMGYYPTEMEKKNMMDEVRFSVLTEEGQHKSHIDRDTFIQLFVNHRPVYGIGKNDITQAFQDILALKGHSVDPDDLYLYTKDLIGYLRLEGEQMRMEDLEDAFQLLIGRRDFREVLEDKITADEFAENILGFEEVDEDEMQDEQ